jgi:hypothetical protein
VHDLQPGPATPRVCGVAHQRAFVASIFAGTALVLIAPSSPGAAGGGDLRHQRRGAVREQRAVSPVRGAAPPAAALAGALVIAVWAGAAAAIVLTLAWIDAPEWLVALPVRATGWVGALAF